MDWHLGVPVVVVLDVPSCSTDRDFDCQISLSQWLKWCTLTGGCQAGGPKANGGVLGQGALSPRPCHQLGGMEERCKLSSGVRVRAPEEVGFGASKIQF